MLTQDLKSFLAKASLATYASGVPAKKDGDFLSYEYTKGDFQYKDKYCGHFQSWGSEEIYQNNKLRWVSHYGGGLEKEYYSLDKECFAFLGKCLSEKSPGSARGPRYYTDGDWEYNYRQTGELDRFSGCEEISYKGKLVFVHHIFGGEVINSIEN